MLRMLSLFSGIGGIDLAAQWTGQIETVAFCEIEPFCQKVLKKHWPKVPVFDDVRELTKESLSARGITGVDIIAGGFPCQDISVAGKGEGLHAERSGLWFQMLRVISEIRPAWVLAENVPNLRSKGIDIVASGLEEEGYTVAPPLVVGAWAVGAPHKRDRVWVVARRGAERELDHTMRGRRDKPERRTEAITDSDGSKDGIPGQASADELADADSTGRREQCGAEPVQPQLSSSEYGCFSNTGTDSKTSMGRWPSRPGEPQYEWEAPRVLAFTNDRDGKRRQWDAGLLQKALGREGAGEISDATGEDTTNGAKDATQSRLGDSANGLSRPMAGRVKRT